MECIPCIVNSFVRLLKTDILPEEKKETGMRNLLNFLAEADYGQSPPALAKEMHQMIRRVLKNPDPYRDIKERSNGEMLELYPELTKMVEEADDSIDMALRLAVAGNVIDFGSQHQFNVIDTINRAVQATLAIDDSTQLKKDLSAANSVLYIGDNCGEIVLDKLLIETLGHQNISFVVRGGPIINDATKKEALAIGMDHFAKVITTGDDAPGALLESASHEFRQIFKKADVVISKGQGNLEGLMGRDQNIYFLLVVKCDLVAKHLGVRTGDFVVRRNRSLEFSDCGYPKRPQ